MKNYKNKRCWQATTQVNLRKGTVIEQKLQKTGWLMLYINWDKLDPSWEKVLNVSFNLKQIGEKMKTIQTDTKSESVPYKDKMSIAFDVADSFLHLLVDRPLSQDGTTYTEAAEELFDTLYQEIIDQISDKTIHSLTSLTAMDLEDMSSQGYFFESKGSLKKIPETTIIGIAYHSNSQSHIYILREAFYEDY